MVNLFSRVLRLDEEGYFLVTPVEKIQIEVEDKPFVIVDFEIAFKNEKQIITFRTNTDEIFDVNDNNLEVREFWKLGLPLILIVLLVMCVIGVRNSRYLFYLDPFIFASSALGIRETWKWFFKKLGMD